MVSLEVELFSLSLTTAGSPEKELAEIKVTEREWGWGDCSTLSSSKYLHFLRFELKEFKNEKFSCILSVINTQVTEFT